jgi:hypothetical protein
MVEIMKNATDYHELELETREWVLAALWSLMMVFFPIYTFFSSFLKMNIIVGVPIMPTLSRSLY